MSGIARDSRCTWEIRCNQRRVWLQGRALQEARDWRKKTRRRDLRVNCETMVFAWSRIRNVTHRICLGRLFQKSQWTKFLVSYLIISLIVAHYSLFIHDLLYNVNCIIKRYSISQKWVHPSHFGNQFSIYFQGTVTWNIFLDILDIF